MAFVKNYDLIVDLKSNISNVIPFFVVGDNGVLNFRIFDESRAFDLTEYTSSELLFHLPNGQNYVGQGQRSGNIVTYQMSGMEIARPGNIKVILSLHSENRIVSVEPFYIVVHDNFRNQEITYVSTLQSLTANMTYLSDEFSESVRQITELRQQYQDLLNSHPNFNPSDRENENDNDQDEENQQGRLVNQQDEALFSEIDTHIQNNSIHISLDQKNEWNNKTNMTKYQIELDTNWTEESEGYFSRTLELEELNEEDTVFVNLIQPELISESILLNEEYNKISQAKNLNGEIIFICYEEPTNLNLNLELVVLNNG